jgi:hypothetical protein
LIVQPDFASDFISTKIYEIIYAKTPIILISKQGKLAEFITQNNLGIHISHDDIKQGLECLLEKKEADFSFEKFPIDNYSYSSLTRELVSFLTDSRALVVKKDDEI